MKVRIGRQTIKFFFLSLLIASFLFVMHYIQFNDFFSIRTVRVYGVNRIDHARIQAFLTPLVERGFFSVNVEAIRDRLLQIPWVSDVLVRRVWPDRIEVVLSERRPLARWNTDSLLSDAGEVFSPEADSESPSDHALPRLIGPTGEQLLVLRYFNEVDRILQPLHARVAVLELTPYLTWKLTLDNGLKMQFGLKDSLTRLGQFVKVYPKIAGRRAEEMDYVDLRYSNGVAVHFKKNTLNDRKNDDGKEANK